jgi:hypothetical protein
VIRTVTGVDTVRAYDHVKHFAALHERLGALSEADKSDVDEAFGGRPRGTAQLRKGPSGGTSALVERVV